MKVAFIGIGQHYPSHVWMRRMRGMLDRHIVLSVDDGLNKGKREQPRPGTVYIPRKLGRLHRVLGCMGLSRDSSKAYRSRWLLELLREQELSHVFVHFLDFSAQFADVWKALEIPVIVHCHGYDISWDVRHHVHGTPLHDSTYPQEVRDLPENVWFIANSTYTIGQLRQIGINPAKVFLKRFGVPLSDRPQAVSTNEAARILFLGRLVDFKGPVETVQAFEQIIQLHPKAVLEIAGDGLLAQEVERSISHLGISDSVLCHGAVDQDQGKQLRQTARIFTQHNQQGTVTRQQEAFGVSLLEAMGEGVPVVTGRSGGVTDFIQHGENGLLFTPRDIEAHASCLDRLLSSNSLCRSMGEAAWETVRSGYQTRHELDDLLYCFDEAKRLGGLPTTEGLRQAAA